MVQLKVLSLVLRLWLAHLICSSVARGFVSINLKSTANSSSVFESYQHNSFYDRSYSNFEDVQWTGYLHKVSPDQSCSTVPHIPDSANGTNWFAVLRSIPSCFDDVLKSISKAGYDLVLVADSSGHNSSSSSLTNGLPFVLISKDYADYLIENALSEFTHPDVLATVTGNNTLFVVVVSISGAAFIAIVVTLLILLLVCVSVCYVRCTETSPEVNHSPTNVQRMADRSSSVQSSLGTDWIKRLPRKRYRNKSFTFETCAICCNELKNGDSVRLLPCGHNTLHTACLDDWFQYRRTCPLCRHDVTKKMVKVPTDGSYDDVDDNTPLIPENRRV